MNCQMFSWLLSSGARGGNGRSEILLGTFRSFAPTNSPARKGSRPRASHDQRTQSTYLFGAVCRNAEPVPPSCCPPATPRPCSFISTGSTPRSPPAAGVRFRRRFRGHSGPPTPSIKPDGMLPQEIWDTAERETPLQSRYRTQYIGGSACPAADRTCEWQSRSAAPHGAASENRLWIDHAAKRIRTGRRWPPPAGVRFRRRRGGRFRGHSGPPTRKEGVTSCR